MPIVPNFTAVQSASDYTEITVTDTSTGSDSNITQRRLYFIQANGSYLITDAAINEEYFEWDYADASITIADLIDKDYALNVKVEWLDVSNTVLYTKTILNGYNAYENAYLYSLTNAQASNPTLINNANFYLNKIALRVNVDDATQAIELGGDIYSAQASYDRGTNIKDNPKTFF